MMIPIAKPYLGDEEKQAVCDVMNSGWLAQGTKVAEFERRVCEVTGTKFAVASSSCTASLHMALLALGIGSGDEVLVPAFTFTATANAVEHAGARPVFVDIDPSTLNIDSNEVELYLRHDRDGRIKAIIPVHLFGLCVEMERLLTLAESHGLHVVEDAACALGSSHNSRPAGSIGDVGCFSFHPRKSITTGEGGMLTTNDPAIAERAQSLRNHGATVSDFQRHEQGVYSLPEFATLGYNYRMTDIQAAIGIEQVKKLSWIIQQQREIAARYDETLGSADWLQLPLASPGRTYQSYVVVLRTADVHLRDSVMAALAEKDIMTRPGTYAVHALGYYRKKYRIREDDFPNTLRANRLSIALPLYAGMTDEEQAYVVKNLLAIGDSTGLGRLP